MNVSKNNTKLSWTTSRKEVFSGTKLYYCSLVLETFCFAYEQKKLHIFYKNLVEISFANMSQLGVVTFHRKDWRYRCQNSLNECSQWTRLNFTANSTEHDCLIEISIAVHPNLSNITFLVLSASLTGMNRGCDKWVTIMAFSRL